MKSEINNWIDILREAWSNLVSDYRKLGERSGYAHRREEDIRCFLFCKIMDLLQERDKFLLDLAADVPILNQKADIGLAPKKEDGWKIALEIKRTGKLDKIKEDLEKLRNFLERKKIEAGVFLTIAEHSENLREKLTQSINTEFKLEGQDQENNNFTEWHRIKIDKFNMDWDTLFLVLRKV